MSKIHRIAGTTDSKRIADIIFVHGLNPMSGDSNKFAFETWGGKDINSDFWPKWLAEDLQKPENGGHRVGVWLAEYDSAASGWFGTTMPLPDRATNVLEGLYEERLGKKPIIFICHSMGGLVVKKVLQRGLTERKIDWEDIVHNVRGVVFLSTPHTGADFASFMGKLKLVLRLTDSMADLQENAAPLRETSEWYRDNCLGYGIDTRAYGETRKTHGVLVVDETSANPHVPGRTVILLDADHSGVCKPTRRDVQPYKGVLRFVEECISNPLPRPFDSRFSGETSKGTPGERSLVASRLINVDHYFTGRETELARVEEWLKGGGEAQGAAAIAGLGGVGKSSLARRYAKIHAGDYDAVFYLNASGVASLNVSYREIDRQFEPQTPAEASDEMVREKVKDYLHSHDRYLLIVDNADFGPGYTPEDLKAYLPGNIRGHALITTRAASAMDALGIVPGRVMTLTDMDKGDAERLLWERVKGEGVAIPGEETATLAALAEALYCFPLALEQAAAFIREQVMTHADYLEDQAKGLVALLNEQKANNGILPQDEQYRRAIETTWAHNVAVLWESGKEASADLLTISAYLAPDAIPLKEIVDAAALTIDSVKAFFADQEPEKRRHADYAKLLKPLTDYCLVTKNEATGTYDIHRLLQEVIRWQISNDERIKLLGDIIAVVDKAFPLVEYENWMKCERLIVHAQEVITYAKADVIQTILIARLCNQMGSYLKERANYIEAEPLYIESLAIHRQALPEGHLVIAVSLNNLAELYREQKRFDEAEALYIESLMIRKKGLPESHPNIAESLNNVATLYQEQGRYKEAETLYAECLLIDRQAPTVNYLNVAMDLTNIGALYRTQGRYAEAMPLYLEALNMCRECLPKNHPHTAVTLNNLALLYQVQGEYNNAQPLLAESVVIMHNNLGDLHPNSQMVNESLKRLVLEKNLMAMSLTSKDFNQMPDVVRQAIITESLSQLESLIERTEAGLC